DLDGGTQLACLHKQLRDVLDPKAAKGCLGAVLLARGREPLALAGAVWKVQKKQGLTKQVEEILASWGEVPTPCIGIAPGSSRKEIGRLLDSPDEGRALSAPSIGRALDLLALCCPREGVESVLACLDGTDHLSELLVLYRARISERFANPRGLG